jgi:hypothetical protein
MTIITRMSQKIKAHRGAFAPAYRHLVAAANPSREAAADDEV